MNRGQINNLSRTLCRAVVLAALCLSPSQWSFEPMAGLHVTPGDIALLLAAGVWALDTLVRRDWARLWRLPPWPHWLFLGCVAASFLTAPDKGAAVKDFAQYVAYFMVGSMLFESFLREGEQCARKALAVLAAVAGAVLALALAQYFGGGEDPLLVRGTFGNRNVLGGFLALALPFCCAGLMGAPNNAVKTFCAVMLAFGMAVNLSAASYFAVALVFLCMAAAKGARWFLPVAAGLLLWQNAVLPRLPRENDIAHYRSVALYDESGEPERRYPEWQAAYSLVLTHPWTGVGPGNYQKQIGRYYAQVPRRTGPAEPDTQNLYLVLAASLGLPGLLAFMAMLAYAAAAALRGAAGAAPEDKRWQARGTAGALGAFAITAIWHPLLVRGIGLPLVFVLALARCIGQAESTDGKQADRSPAHL
ncbi:MAG: O-antigen ligase family protein [Kiritimatiellae bacterium]|nr:O-antigen ligase family protein [Kiritimatiellia bacterium]MDD4024707.1 O-antigen ligase family protein [Kiritimatiellia bacterium]